jgi:hypothetical protein
MRGVTTPSLGAKIKSKPGRLQRQTWSADVAAWPSGVPAWPQPVKVAAPGQALGWFTRGFIAKKQAKKFKKGVAMGVGSAYGARPQFRGSLGFAGYFTPNLCGII